jgi:hypothetical protein
MDFAVQVMEIEVGTDNNYSGGLNFSMPVVNASLWNSITLSQMDGRWLSNRQGLRSYH